VVLATAENVIRRFLICFFLEKLLVQWIACTGVGWLFLRYIGGNLASRKMGWIGNGCFAFSGELGAFGTGYYRISKKYV